jgi:hypothetical protein
MSAIRNCTLAFKCDKNWDDLSENMENKLITFKDIYDNPDLPWNYHVISYNYATWNDYISYPDFPHWDKVNMAHMKDLTLLNIIENPHINWDFEVLSYREFLTQEFILNNKHQNWDIIALSSNKCVTLEFILKNNDIKWSEEGMIHNPNIHIEYFLNKEKFQPYLNLLQTRFIYFNKDINDFDMDDIFENIMLYPIDWDYEIIAAFKSFDINKFFELKIDFTLNEEQIKKLYNGLSNNKYLDFHKDVLPRINAPWNFKL